MPPRDLAHVETHQGARPAWVVGRNEQRDGVKGAGSDRQVMPYRGGFKSQNGVRVPPQRDDGSRHMVKALTREPFVRPHGGGRSAAVEPGSQPLPRAALDAMLDLTARHPSAQRFVEGHDVGQTGWIRPGSTGHAAMVGSQVRRLTSGKAPCGRRRDGDAAWGRPKSCMRAQIRSWPDGDPACAHRTASHRPGNRSVERSAAVSGHRVSGGSPGQNSACFRGVRTP